VDNRARDEVRRRLGGWIRTSAEIPSLLCSLRIILIDKLRLPLSTSAMRVLVPRTNPYPVRRRPYFAVHERRGASKRRLVVGFGFDSSGLVAADNVVSGMIADEADINDTNVGI
jgi:hypothetical protein